MDAKWILVKKDKNSDPWPLGEIGGSRGGDYFHFMRRPPPDLNWSARGWYPVEAVLEGMSGDTSVIEPKWEAHVYY